VPRRGPSERAARSEKGRAKSGERGRQKKDKEKKREGEETSRSEEETVDVDVAMMDRVERGTLGTKNQTRANQRETRNVRPGVKL